MSQRNKRTCAELNSSSELRTDKTLSSTTQKKILAYIVKLQDRLESLENTSTTTQGLLIEFEDKIMSKIDKIQTDILNILTDINDVKARVSDLESALTELKEFTLKEITDVKSDFTAVNDRLSIIEKARQQDSINQGILKSDVYNFKSRIQHLENASVSTELRINGIPYSRDENLCDIFAKICHKMNINVPAIMSIFRLQNQNNKHKQNSPNAVIIVQMMSPYDKNFFLKSLAEVRKSQNNFSLRLHDLGYNSDSVFYVNENLTRNNYIVFQNAMKLKKDKLIHGTFTMRGLVYIKQTPTAQPIQIDNIDELNGFFRATVADANPDNANTTQHS